MAGCNRCEDFNYQGEEEEEETLMGKKYGGLVPKKKPLISKSNERAFFDSADWALGKQGAGMGQKSRAVVETLRPKLQIGQQEKTKTINGALNWVINMGGAAASERTPHQQLPPRRPACTSGRETLME